MAGPSQGHFGGHPFGRTVIAPLVAFVVLVGGCVDGGNGFGGNPTGPQGTVPSTTTTGPAGTTTRASTLATTTTASTTAATTTVTTTTTTVGTAETPAGSSDLRRVPFGRLGRRGTVAVTIEPGDMSFIVWATAQSDDAPVFVTGVVSPTGSDVGDAAGLEYGDLSNFGEAAFYLPMTPATPLSEGDYLITFETDDVIVDAGALVRSGDPNIPQAIDVVFWVVTPDDLDTDELAAEFRRVADRVFGPHEITVGEMEFLEAPAEVVERFATLRLPNSDPTDAALRSLCREMSDAVGEKRALNVAIVDRINGGGRDVVIEGTAAGLPGTAMLAGSGLGCVAAMAGLDRFEPDRDLVDRAVVVWHEAGHLMGLFHTTEAEGDLFDIIDDTPECRRRRYDTDADGFVDFRECWSADGGNFMFHDGDGTRMTDGQAWPIRRHALLYPAGKGFSARRSDSTG